ncbi:SAGA complex subunit Sgf73 [Maublancomyces gigas]|uniref:SAGA complex subunit Sgf73 n=1 Tax=Discina gigas TaxID=1032678 RepID=A0ABR3GMD5_9PEZI
MTRFNDAVLKQLFSDRELSTTTIKLKNPPARKASKYQPNWKERAQQLENAEDSPTNTKSPGPVITQLDDKDISTFPTGRPLDDQPDYTVCKHCKKPVTKPAAVAHIKACLKAKSDKAKERKRAKEAAAAAERGGKDKDGAATTVAGEKPSGEDAEGSVVGDAPVGPKKGAKKMARKEGDAAKSKKRKADEPKLPKEPKAKKKKEKPAKTEKPKAPVDVEKQCGVQLPNGALCARSLTCKSHSMGAKRGVLGRSQPYDALLAAYQKKNQAKIQKAAINAGAPPPDEIEANAIPVDSDEETELVMAAVARSCPQPIERHILVPVRRKYQYVRMREMLASALKPMGGPMYSNDTGVFDGQGGGAQRMLNGGPQGQGNRGFSLQTPQRKGSVNVGGG